MQPEIPTVVLDTNAVLDWLVFRDPRLSPLPVLLAAGRARWVTTAAMQAEFEHVIARAPLRDRNPDTALLAHAWAAHAVCVPPPAQPAPWHCRDRSDQMFLDLAAAHRAAALLTRDRSLLALARRARAAGLTICPPERWLGSVAAAVGATPGPASGHALAGQPVRE